MRHLVNSLVFFASIRLELQTLRWVLVFDPCPACVLAALQGAAEEQRERLPPVL